jgi:hypothetical protein
VCLLCVVVDQFLDVGLGEADLGQDFVGGGGPGSMASGALGSQEISTAGIVQTIKRWWDRLIERDRDRFAHWQWTGTFEWIR